jgi:hypothetical protein
MINGSLDVKPDNSIASHFGTEQRRMPVCYIFDEDPQICHFLSVILFGPRYPNRRIF